MKFAFLFLVGLAGVILSSCATTYQPLGMTGGYSDYALADDQFEVYYDGNAYTSQDIVYQLFLTRAAQLALNNHDKYFYVLKTENTTRTEAYVTPGALRTRDYTEVYRTYARSRYGDRGYLNTQVVTTSVTIRDPASVQYVQKPGFRGQILLVNEALKDQPEPFDAQRVYNDGMELQKRLEQQNTAIELSAVGIAVAAVFLAAAVP